MGRKSNSLFAILVTPLSVNRDNKLSEILNQPANPNIFLYFGNGCFTLNLGYTKTWKTLNGANNFLKKVVRRTGSKYFVLDNAQNQEWDRVNYKVVSIEVEWNEYIDNQLQKENERHQKSIDRLNKMKVIK